MIENLRNTTGWMMVFFAISFAAILATAAATPPASDTFSEPGDVTRQDGWPESKKRHMEEGDFWYWVESMYAQGALPIPAGTDAALEEGSSTSPFELEALDEFHELDLFIWCALLPLLTYGWLGLGVGGWDVAETAVLARPSFSLDVWPQHPLRPIDG